VRLLVWFGGVLLKFGSGLLTGLLSRIEEIARFPKRELLAENGVWILSWLVCLSNISSQVIFSSSSSGSSRFSAIKKELL